MPVRYVIHDSLLSLLVERFALQIELFPNLLCKSTLIRDWLSHDPDDGNFAAETGPEEDVLPGRNSFIFKPDGGPILDQFEAIMRSHQPTRIICLAPTEEITSLAHQHRQWLEIARFERGIPLISVETSLSHVVSSSFSIGLFINRESLIFDSLNWAEFKEEIREWAASYGIALTVPMITDNLFKERALPTSRGRTVVFPSSSSGLFHFFDGRREKTNESQYLQQNGVPAHTAKLIAKINQHKPELSALGILPNQIRTLLKGSLDCNEFMEDLSKTLFWYGYKIWKKRVQLVAQFLSNAPQEWKHWKDNKEPSCDRPFHFYSRVGNLSMQKQTICHCSQIHVNHATEIDSAPDIRHFFQQSCESRRIVPIEEVWPASALTRDFLTQEDLVRRDHDRDKRRST
jgi:hypothetical protein